jgi:hypothetical protein
MNFFCKLYFETQFLKFLAVNIDPNYFKSGSQLIGATMIVFAEVVHHFFQKARQNNPAFFPSKNYPILDKLPWLRFVLYGLFFLVYFTFYSKMSLSIGDKIQWVWDLIGGHNNFKYVAICLVFFAIV